MKNILALSFIFFSIGCFAQTTSQFDSVLAESYKADDYGMKTYVLAFLKRGTKGDQYTAEEKADIQKGHMANITRLVEAKKMVLAGPFMDNGDLRGLFFFDVPTIEEAEQLVATDPAIIAGVLAMELKLWYGSAALLALPDIHKKVQKLDF
jgi:uncharacterized protein YciI